MKKIGKNGKLRDFKLLGIVGVLIIFALLNINFKVLATTDNTIKDNETSNNTNDTRRYNT